MIRNRRHRKSASYIYYFFLGGYLAVEPFFLKQIFAIYLPDFHYRAFTVPISASILLIGFQSFSKTSKFGLAKELKVIISQVYLNLFDSHYWQKISFKCMVNYKILLNILKIQDFQEPTVGKHLNKAVKYFWPTTISISLLLVIVGSLFLINLPLWGFFDTILTILFYLISIFVLGIAIANLPSVMNTTKQLKNAKISELDLESLLNLLKSELTDWTFQQRVELSSANLKEQRDIDIVAISPQKNHFVIELKSHIGIIIWDSKLRKLCQQLEKSPKSIPLKKDLFNQVNKQAKLLKRAWNLSETPSRFLVFWRAEVRINPKKRLIRGVQISDPSRIVRALEKRNRSLIKDILSSKSNLESKSKTLLKSEPKSRK